MPAKRKRNASPTDELKTRSKIAKGLVDEDDLDGVDTDPILPGNPTDYSCSPNSSADVPALMSLSDASRSAGSDTLAPDDALAVEADR